MTTTTTSVPASTTRTPRTIAQGLRRIKALKGLIAEHTSRANGSVSHVAGTTTTFSFADERAKRSAAQDELVQLESAVAVANATHHVDFDGRRMTLCEAIRRLQEFKADMAWLAALPIREGISRENDSDWDEATGRNRRVVRETTWSTNLKETDRVSQVESLRQRFADLNDLVETANHRTPIVVEASSPPASA